jgi:hypothetical protein
VSRQLYLDCDGVLADFDKGATAILGIPPRAFEDRHGPGRFWRKLAEAPDFYFGLPLMPDAMELFEAVKHLHPIILTGLPRGNWAADQKVRWAALYFPGTRIITTLARDKRDHCRDGDVLVDDQLRHAPLWREAGGIFVHHRNARATLKILARYFSLNPNAREPPPPEQAAPDPAASR